MGLLYAILALAWGDPWTDEEAARFQGQAPAPEPTAEAPVAWHGGARPALRDLVAIEARLRQLGATPDQAVLVSARLDWGTLIRSPGGPDELRFARTGLTVQAQRLSDGAVLREGHVVDEDRVYDLSDPEERARLCTRARAGRLGPLTLETFSESPLAADALPGDPGFLVVDTGERTAMVGLKPGESATVVEVVGRDAERLRVRRSMTVQRGDQVMRLTEGDLMQRVCLDF